VILDHWWGSDFMGVAVGFLVTVILILIAVIVFIMYKNHMNSAYQDPTTYYQTFIPKAGGNLPPELEWEEHQRRGRRFPAPSPRRLPPTPTTSEDHYTDSSMEYSSPLLTASLRHQHPLPQQLPQQQQVVNWESFFPSPPPGTPPVSHYAASDLLYAQPDRKPGLQYFL